MLRFKIVKNVPFAGMALRSRTISNAYETLMFMLKHRRVPDFDRTGYRNDLLHRMRISESGYVERAFSSDKELVKIFVRGVTGEDLCVPTLGVIRNIGDIDGYEFPPDCVVKPTHMSGEVVFVRDGYVSVADRARMKAWMKQNFGVLTGELHYMKLEPKIIIEPWLRLTGEGSDDIKLHLYDGKVNVCELCFNRFGGEARWALMTPDWRLLRVTSPDYPMMDDAEYARTAPEAIRNRPANFDRMIAIAEQIGRHFPYVRVDFYSDGKDAIYIGELSHITANAKERLFPVEVERVFISGQPERIAGLV